MYTVSFRLPDGTRLTRKFESCDTLRYLAIYLESLEDGRALAEGSYRLMTAFPRRCLTDLENAPSLTLEELKLDKEMLTVDLLQ